MIIFAIVFADEPDKEFPAFSTDTVIGVFSACGVALGLVLLSVSAVAVPEPLIGDILSITKRNHFTDHNACRNPYPAADVHNRFNLISISPEIASSRGIPVGLLDNVFMSR